MVDRAGEIPEHDEAWIAERLAASDRPFVTLKAAATLDGKLATRSGESQWITGKAARELGHVLRARHDAVLVGIGTVLADDPRLTVRLPVAAAQPARVVLDSTCRTPPGAKWLADDGARRIVIAGRDARPDRLNALRERGVYVWQAREVRPTPAEFLPWLRAQGLRTILVEGGARVLGAFVANGEADALFLFLAGRLIGDASAPGWCGALEVSRLAETPRLRLSPPRMIGEDVLVHGRFLRTDALQPR
jgi:diaminohydroxyphosphoribosylaminopyrimidine deaminase/5-amino-6-(5-phosphoribosylamino)uracil reductase